MLQNSYIEELTRKIAESVKEKIDAEVKETKSLCISIIIINDLLVLLLVSMLNLF